MNRWYQNAAKCYIYLADVSTNDQNPTKGVSYSGNEAFKKVDSSHADRHYKCQLGRDFGTEYSSICPALILIPEVSILESILVISIRNQ